MASVDVASSEEGASSVGWGVTVEQLEAGDLPPGVDGAFLSARRFEAKPQQTVVVPGVAGPDIVLVGLGKHSSIDASALRRAAAALVRATGGRPVLAAHLVEALPEGLSRTDAARAAAEGAAIAGYSFDRYRTKPAEQGVDRFVLVAKPTAPMRRATQEGARIAGGIALARDLVNTPGGDLTPEALAAVAVEVAEREGLQVSVLDEVDIAEAGLGGLLGVNRGSEHPARLIELTWEPDSPRGSLAFVGKGITFDSGGLSIKSVDGMMTMKDDMAGAAAVLGAFSALSAVGPRCRVRGYIPATDNMSGGDATRPGDVLKIRNGKTVEVLNTDAEGRLVLADALCLASEAQPDAIIDLATLTGAVEVALGNRIAGLMGDHDAWIDQVGEAASRAGERIWRLPLPDDYRQRLDSDVADLRNISKTKDGGTITAALFLREFVADGIPWAHLDIAGTAWHKEGPEAELSRGATGWGVRTLLELARTFRIPAGASAAR